MADANTEQAATQPTEKEILAHHYAEESLQPVLDENGEPERPKGWMYKSFRAGPIYIPWYASPRFQLVMVAFVCFMCPGMFNALSGLGGGGLDDAHTADEMNVALYSTFAVVGFFAGTIVNRIGIQLSMSLGGVGYCIYSISLLVAKHSGTRVRGFNIFAGALLGVCAGILWSAQGAIMLSYPNENKKGAYFAWFWGIFNVGACIGSLIALGTNIDVREAKAVQDGTYIAFIVLMAFGAVLALFLCNGKKVIRSDGSRVVLMKNPSWKSELIGLWETIRFDPYIVLLFPMFWSSNWFYTYQQNAVNAAYFNTRTRALNGFLYWFSQIVGAMILGPLLDLKYFRRSIRAKASLIALFIVTMAIWGGGYAWQRHYTRDDVDPDKGWKGWDWTTSGFVGPMFLYFFYGIYDSLWQGCVYWYMGALSNSGRRSANLVGFYKGIQSAGAAVMWDMDRRKTPFMAELASNWGLLCGSLVVAAPVIWLRIKDHVDVATDIQNTDETLDDVLPEGHTEKRGSVA